MPDVRLVLDPGWALCLEGSLLVVHAGGDRRLELEDCPPVAAGELIDALGGDGADPQALSGDAARAVRQLVLLGALRPELMPPGTPLEVGLIFAGDAPGDLAAELIKAIDPAAVVLTDDPGAARLWLVVRTNATLAQAADRAPRLQPHLFADAAYHHTLSLGPLVIPGQTACVACLAGRIGHRWGDPDPPAAPLAARRLGLLAGWIAAELENVASGSSTLANRTVSMDIASHRMIDHSLLRLPWCPSCGDVPATGRIELPWAPASGPGR